MLFIRNVSKMINEIIEIETETKVEKHIVTFSKSLPSFIEKWRNILSLAASPVKGLVNQADQFRHVERVNIKHMEGFTEIQKGVLFKIVQGIEEEICILHNLMDQLQKVTGDIRNKLTILEKATLNLNWENKESLIIKGSATRPPLERLLQYSLEFWTYFSLALRNISNSLKNINVRDEDAMANIEKAFQIDLENKIILSLIALTQYIDNEKSIV